eukprot:TRINITY_DN2475_c0_g1_i1.p1 TRINITY_DN2475_c0_g1~~TRINITY_DN2475_c0_g1_i1.p1  ORF type:complete len:276 (-),score=64.88 TRINITY_DN2475_c0_g1_i1:284-1111(-)
MAEDENKVEAAPEVRPVATPAVARTFGCTSAQVEQFFKQQPLRSNPDLVRRAKQRWPEVSVKIRKERETMAPPRLNTSEFDFNEHLEHDDFEYLEHDESLHAPPRENCQGVARTPDKSQAVHRASLLDVQRAHGAPARAPDGRDNEEAWPSLAQAAYDDTWETLSVASSWLDATACSGLDDDACSVTSFLHATAAAEAENDDDGAESVSSFLLVDESREERTSVPAEPAAAVSWAARAALAAAKNPSPKPKPAFVSLVRRKARKPKMETVDEDAT